MTTRVTGMVSNLDIDSLVKAGSTMYQSRLDKAKASEQIAEWQQDQYQTISKDVTKFYDKYLDKDSADSLLNPNSWNTASYASSDSTSVTAKATSSSASADNYNVSVTQLASSASAILTDYSNGLKITGGTSATPITIDKSSIEAITNDATLTDKDKAISVTALINKKISNSGMTAMYSELSGGIVLKTNALGMDSKIAVTDAAGTGTQILKDSSGALVSSVTGKNLNATITNSAGTTYTISNTENKTNSNSVTLDNIEYTFTDKTTTKNADGTTTDKPVKLTGSSDVSDVQDKIESFINDYNTLIKGINTKIYESHDKSYQPLTDTQRESMSESEITKWETKAKTGLLRKDDYLEKLTSDMKQTMTSLMSSSGVSLDKIGIKAVDNFTTKNGTFSIDSAKLASALKGGLSNNKTNIKLDDIKELFTAGSSTVTPLTQTTSSANGILTRLKVAVNYNVRGTNSQFTKKAGNEDYETSLSTNEIYKYLKDQTTLIAQLKTKLEDKQDSLYSQYSKLETNLSSLQSSSGLFSSSAS